MKPAAFRIEVSGNDITKVFKDRLQSLLITDVSGQDSDTVTIVLDDRDHAIALPELDVEMQVWMGYEGNLTWAGFFIIDEVSTSDKAGTLTIAGKSINNFSSIKAKRELTYDDITFGDLVNEIASRNNYQGAISDELSSIHFEHIAQTNESDQELLSRLAQKEEATFKASGNQLVIVKKDQSKNAKGEALPVVDIDARLEGIWVDASFTSKTVYSGVKAYFKAPDDGNKKSIIVGERDLLDTIADTFPTEAEATTAAESRLAQLKRQGGQLTITMPGNMDAAAERKLNLTNHRHAGERIINRVRHSIRSGQVFITTLTATPSTK